MKWVSVVKVLEHEIPSSKLFGESAVGSSGRQQLMEVVCGNCTDACPTVTSGVCAARDEEVPAC
jgi:hypothetical protein